MAAVECGQCGSANRAGARFCGGCGLPLTRRCAACQADLDPGLRFCDECGTPVGADHTSTPAVPAPSVPGGTDGAVRKTVTVLFCDLGGSTGFGERTDPEVARQVLARYYALLQEIIDAHDGSVAKFMGDGMMATFGIPEIAEDDAIRAVRAGVDVQRRFATFAAEVEREHGEALVLRVGINTGEVVMATGDADLVGDALNVAARLEKACRPGLVLVGEETWRLTRGEVGFERLGEVTVAGRAQPVTSYEVAAADTESVEPVGPFVGRGPEMDRLEAVFASANASNTARLVTVLGSPGVGKTRLSRELCARVETEAGAVTFEIRCDRAGEATFAPVAQMIREAANLGDESGGDGDFGERVAALLTDDADRARVADVLSGLVGAAGTRSVEETFWAIRRLIESMASTCPLVVVVDDIQWAEPLLLDLLEHLVEWLKGVAVVLVCLARPEAREVRPSLTETGRHVDVLALDGLDSAATEALAAGLLGTDRLPAGLVERLPASTDGNPLFVRELVRMLVDDEVVRRVGDEWELTIDADAVEVPPTIQSLLATRVERLPHDERDLLELASVVGAEFSLGALRELARGGTPVPSLLEAMRRKELVEPTGSYWGDEPVHRFHHVLIRDAAYRRLLKTTRAHLHERVARWTDRTSEGLVGEHEAAIAFHYEQAFRYRTELGSLDDETRQLGRRAAQLLELAAQRALGRDDLASAGALARRAIALVPEGDGTARADLLVIACECLLSSGDVVAAAPLVEQLAEIALGDDGMAAWAACFEAQLVGLTDPEGLLRADEQATAAAATLQELGDRAGEAKAHSVRAGLLARLGRVGDAEVVLDLALAAARSADDRRRVTAVLGAAPVAALFGPSPVARAGGRCLDVVRLLRITTASPSVEATSMRCQAVLEALRGRLDVSRTMLASARASLEELGLEHGLLETELFTGMVELIAGDPAAAIAPLRTAYEGLGTLGVGADAGQAAALLSRALLAQGDVDNAATMATASEELAGQNLKTAILWRIARAEVLAARGDITPGVALAQEAVEIAAGTDYLIDHADACVALARLREESGDLAGARAARTEALRLYELKGATVPAQRLAGRDPSVAAAPAASGHKRAPEPAAPGAEHETRTARAENLLTRQSDRFIALVSAGCLDEAAALIDADILSVDSRRTVSSPTFRGRDEFMANVRGLHEVGMTEWTSEPLAVRGDHLALSRATLRTLDGSEVTALNVAEISPEGRNTYTAWFDADDLDAAVDELETRYLAGEGAADAERIRAATLFDRPFRRRDWDALRDQMAPDLVVVDHRDFGWPSGGPDVVVAMFRGLVDLAPDAFLLFRTHHLVGQASLATIDTRGATPEGNAYEWVTHCVAVVDGSGRATRLEPFAEDDFDAALARLDELGAADPRTDRAENASTRGADRFLMLVSAGRLEEAGELVADDHVQVDRRTTVSATPLQGKAEFLASVRATIDVGLSTITSEPIAVRGDRLSLSRIAFRSADRNELVALAVSEDDRDGLAIYLAFFDEDDLEAAQDELDERYVAGEGAPHADFVRMNREWRRSLEVWDLDRHRDLMAEDFVMVDRRELGWPEFDRDGYIEMQRVYAEAFSFQPISLLQRNGHVVGRAGLATTETRGVSSDGVAYEWVFHGIGQRDDTGRISRLELFAEDDFEAALGRLDQLGAGSVAGPAPSPAPAPPELENSVTRSIERLFELGAAGDFDLTRFVTEDILRFDKRHSVSTPTLHGRVEFEENLRAIYDVFDSGALEPIAIRGERVALARVILSHDGFAASMLGVYETNDQGLLCRGTSFDEEDLDAALDELEDRYLDGEGSEHEYIVRRLQDTARARRSRTVEAMDDLISPDFTVVDHRRIGSGSLDADAMRAAQQARLDQTTEDRSRHRWRKIRGDVVLAELDTLGTTPEGNEYNWSFLVVWQLAAGKWIRLELFDLDAGEDAHERFEELAEQTRTPFVDNRVVRITTRGQWRTEFEGLIDTSIYSPDCVLIDHRTGVNAGEVVGGQAVSDSIQSGIEVFGGLHLEAVAVRGDHLALYRWVFAQDGGFEAPGLCVVETDEDDRTVRVTSFDEADLATAIELLDERHAAIAGDTYTDIEGTVARGLSILNGQNIDAYEQFLAPDVTVIDHLPVNFPPAHSSREFTRMLRRLFEMAPDTTFVIPKIFVAGRAMLSVQRQQSTTPEGNVYVWVRHTVTRYSPDARLTRCEFFPEDRWDDALVLFDKWANS